MSNTSTETALSKNNSFNPNDTWKRAQIIVKTKNNIFFKNNSKLTKANLDKINKSPVCKNEYCYYCDRKFNKIVCRYLDNKSDMSSITTNDSSENSS
jgi:hypothetical protein